MLWLLEASFSADQLRETTAQRMRQRVTLSAMPRASDFARILATAGLPRALADVDRLVYATAVHQGMTVVTGDIRLARALTRHGQYVGNMALILKTLVTTHMVSPSPHVMPYLAYLREAARFYSASMPRKPGQHCRATHFPSWRGTEVISLSP